jgi:hypothetical protein
MPLGRADHVGGQASSPQGPEHVEPCHVGKIDVKQDQVTGSGFIVLAATLSTVGSIPVAGIMLIFGIDKFMSECRALTNMIGNSVAAIEVAKWEGQLDLEQAGRVLNSSHHATLCVLPPRCGPRARRSGHPGRLARPAPPQPLEHGERALVQRLECPRRLTAEQAFGPARLRLDPPGGAGRGGMHTFQPRPAVHLRPPRRPGA